MAVHAIEDLDDALTVTRRFLTPVDRGVWVRLAFVALFIAVPGSNMLQWNVGGNGADPTGLPEITLRPAVWALIGVVLLVVVALVLAVAFVGSVMEFVFYESLRTQTVTVRRYWGRRWRQGLRLLGFRLALGLVVLWSLLILVAPFVLAWRNGGQVGDGLWLPFLALFLPVVLTLVVTAAILYGFTTVFVVPIMILEDCGVIAGWRRLWPALTRDWQQFLAYAVASLILGFLGGVLVGILGALLAVVLLIPFGLFAAVGAGLLLLGSPIGWAIIAIVAVLFVLTLIAGVALIQVPVRTYLRYYAVFVLGDIDPDLDLIPDLRAAVRSTD